MAHQTGSRRQARSQTYSSASCWAKVKATWRPSLARRTAVSTKPPGDPRKASRMSCSTAPRPGSQHCAGEAAEHPHAYHWYAITSTGLCDMIRPHLTVHSLEVIDSAGQSHLLADLHTIQNSLGWPRELEAGRHEHHKQAACWARDYLAAPGLRGTACAAVASLPQRFLLPAHHPGLRTQVRAQMEAGIVPSLGDLQHPAEVAC